MGAISEDGDCDGVLTADDCDDEDPDSTTVATDADCDGVLTADAEPCSTSPALRTYETGLWSLWYTQTNRLRGNWYLADATGILDSFKMGMEADGVDLGFFVYSATSSSGEGLTLEWSMEYSDVSSSGRYVSSGPIGLEVEAEKYYALVVGWIGTTNTAMGHGVIGESVGWGTSGGWTSDNTYGGHSGYDGSFTWGTSGTYDQLVLSECAG